MKELPYYQFFPNDWLGGKIAFQSREVQGFFVHLCALYWKNKCQGDLTQLRGYIPDMDQYMGALIDAGIVVKKGDKIEIKFLKKQRSDFLKKSKRNSENGRKGGRPKGLAKSDRFNVANRKPESRKAFSYSYSNTDISNNLGFQFRELFGNLSPLETDELKPIFESNQHRAELFMKTAREILKKTDKEFIPKPTTLAKKVTAALAQSSGDEETPEEKARRRKAYKEFGELIKNNRRPEDAQIFDDWYERYYRG